MRVFRSPNPAGRRRQKDSRAFTLIETMMTMVIVSVAITAFCELLAAGTMANISGNELTTAVNQANTIHEIAVGLSSKQLTEPQPGPRQDVWDLNGKTFSPPIDAARRPISSFGNWEQRIAVTPVDTTNLIGSSPTDQRSRTARLTVEIYHEKHLVHTANWLIAAN
jgi:prepilin-type N-terminal cleavage/methylation domain-containing protein